MLFSSLKDAIEIIKNSPTEIKSIDNLLCLQNIIEFDESDIEMLNVNRREVLMKKLMDIYFTLCITAVGNAKSNIDEHPLKYVNSEYLSLEQYSKVVLESLKNDFNSFRFANLVFFENNGDDLDINSNEVIIPNINEILSFYINRANNYDLISTLPVFVKEYITEEMCISMINRSNSVNILNNISKFPIELISNSKKIIKSGSIVNYKIFEVYASSELKKDRNFIMELLISSPLIIYSLSSNFRDDKDLVLLAIDANNGGLIDCVSDRLREDYDVVKKSISYPDMGIYFVYASEKLRENYELALIALSNSSLKDFFDIFNSLSPKLRMNSNFLNEIMPLMKDAEDQVGFRF